MLCAENLGVAFDDQWLFRGVSLSIEPGQRIALVGPSGSGKSILLKSLATLHRTDEGSVSWNGELVEGHRVTPFRSQVMYVAQQTADEELTVEAYLRLPFSLAVHRDKQWCQREAIELLGRLGRRPEFLDKPQRELSGGERQIAAVIRTLLLKPSVLLLDEPTSAMDRDIVRSTEEVVLNWAQQDDRRSMIWVSHDEDQANRVSSAIVTIDTLKKNDQ